MADVVSEAASSATSGGLGDVLQVMLRINLSLLLPMVNILARNAYLCPSPASYSLISPLFFAGLFLCFVELWQVME